MSQPKYGYEGQRWRRGRRNLTAVPKGPAGRLFFFFFGKLKCRGSQRDPAMMPPPHVPVNAPTELELSSNHISAHFTCVPPIMRRIDTGSSRASDRYDCSAARPRQGRDEWRFWLCPGQRRRARSKWHCSTRAMPCGGEAVCAVRFQIEPSSRWQGSGW